MDFNQLFEGFSRILNEWFIAISVGLIAGSRSLFEFFFGWLPDFPNFPQDILQGFYNFLDIPFSSGAYGFLGWIFGGYSVIAFVFFGSLSIFLFRISFDLIMFIITKLPIGVKR